MTREEITEAVNKTFIEILEGSGGGTLSGKGDFQRSGARQSRHGGSDDGLQRRFGISLRQNEEIRKIVTLGDIYDFFVKMEQEHSGQKSPEQKKQDS